MIFAEVLFQRGAGDAKFLGELLQGDMAAKIIEKILLGMLCQLCRASVVDKCS